MHIDNLYKKFLADNNITDSSSVKTAFTCGVKMGCAVSLLGETVTYDSDNAIVGTNVKKEDKKEERPKENFPSKSTASTSKTYSFNEGLKPKDDDREPLKHIEKGDIVVYYDKWEDKITKGIMIVNSFNYGKGDMPGSVPICCYGRSHISGIYYSDFMPGTSTYYKATEDEIDDFFKNSPKNDTFWPWFLLEQNPNVLGKWKNYIDKYFK